MKGRDLVLLLLFPFLVALGYVVAKSALTDVPPILFAAFRYTITALVLVWFFPPPSARILRRLVWITFVATTLQFSLTYSGIQLLDVSTAALLIQTEVPFAMLLSTLLLRTVLSIDRIIGVVIAFAGIVLIVGTPSHGGSMIGIALVLSGAFVWGLGQVMIEKLDFKEGFRLVAYMAVCAAPQLWIASFALEQNQLVTITNMSWQNVLIILYVGLGPSAIGYGIWYSMIARYDVNRVAPVMLLVPVFTVLLGMLLLSERPEVTVLLGGAIVVAGVAICIWPKNNDLEQANG